MNKQYITQKEALNILKKVKYSKQDSVYALRYFLLLNNYAKKKLKRRLYTIFELMGIKDFPDALSYTISNIEELSKEKRK